MIPQEVIASKRDGRELDPATLTDFLDGYANGSVGDEQMSAMLMAIYFRGLSGGELSCLVDVMLNSGAVLDLEHLPGPRVDKHSTGGVGDKVSLALAPLAADLGLFVPMMSGRGLGHTGGTLDKLEAIPGFRTQLTIDEFERILADVGCAMIGQTPEIAPLDKRLYALRDVTGTVSSLPLITASIMSKKLAEGLSGLVLDVKVGAGAFLPEIEEARALARAMVGVGRRYGVETHATLSAMDRPLGRAIGNALEVAEALEFLRGGPSSPFGDLTLHLAAQMAVVGGIASSFEVGLESARRSVSTGRALERFGRLIEAQGGDREVADGQALLPLAAAIRMVTAPTEGVVGSIDPRRLGYGLIRLGGGRTRQGQTIDPSVGFELMVEVGDVVSRGQPLARVHARSEAELELGADVVRSSIDIGDAAGVDALPLIVDEIGAASEKPDGQDTSSL